MTIAEAVSSTGLSLSTVRRALGTGALQHSRVGLGRGGIRIHPSDLARFLTPRPVQRRRTDRGFTLIQAIWVVLLVGILTALAAPPFLNHGAPATGGSHTSSATATVQYATGGTQ